MHVALVVDDERLHWEHAAINRLCIALVTEGVQLTRIVPEGIMEADPQSEQRMALIRRIGAPLDTLPWTRGTRCARLLKAMDKSRPEVVHVIGERAWGLGLDLGRALDCPVSLELNRQSQVLRVPRGRSARHVAAYLAPTLPIAEALRVRVDSDLVSFVPVGVALPSQAHAPLSEPDAGIAAVILGAARDLAVYRAMLDALARITKRYSQLQLFLELPSRRSHDIWRHAQRVGLLPRLTVISHAGHHRSLVTRCDLALLPQSAGAVRSVTLELMAHGIPIVATPDPWLDYFIEGETATLVSGLDVDEWDQRIGRWLANPEVGQAQGARARHWMTHHRTSSAQAEGLLTTLQRVVSGSSLPFAATA